MAVKYNLNNLSINGIKGNAYVIMNYVSRAMHANDYSDEEISNYYKEASEGDYDHMLHVSEDILNKINNKEV